MGKVINFKDHYIKSRDCTVEDFHRIQGMRRWYFRNRRGMQERDEKLKRQDELPEEHNDQ
jgi:hypothetical protein